jgi:hypothetical protein
MPFRLNIPPPAGACRKVQHRTEEAAKEHLLDTRAHNAVYGSGTPGLELHVYKCSRCGFYHVGHDFPERRRG